MQQCGSLCDGHCWHTVGLGEEVTRSSLGQLLLRGGDVGSRCFPLIIKAWPEGSDCPYATNTTLPDQRTSLHRYYTQRALHEPIVGTQKCRLSSVVPTWYPGGFPSHQTILLCRVPRLVYLWTFRHQVPSTASRTAALPRQPRWVHTRMEGTPSVQYASRSPCYITGCGWSCPCLQRVC